MNRDLKLEMRMSAMRMASYDKHKEQMKVVADQLIALAAQEYEYIGRVKRKLTNSAKYSRAKKIIDKLAPIDIDQDVRNQLKIMNNGR